MRTENVRIGASVQKFSYCEILSAAPGVSLTTLTETNGTPLSQQVCAMDADSISTAATSG